MVLLAIYLISVIVSLVSILVGTIVEIKAYGPSTIDDPIVELVIMAILSSLLPVVNIYVIWDELVHLGDALTFIETGERVYDTPEDHL